jgi:hypothetical protein
LVPHIKIIDPAKEVAGTADEALQMMGWRRWGRREGSFSYYESGEGPKQIKEFARFLYPLQNLTEYERAFRFVPEYVEYISLLP